MPHAPSPDFRVLVRAVDRAGNVRDESVNVHVPASARRFIQNNLIAILLGLLGLGLFSLIIHYLFGHHILARLRLILRLLRRQEQIEQIKEQKQALKEPEGHQGPTPLS